jgi:hypothetical protein
LYGVAESIAKSHHPLDGAIDLLGLCRESGSVDLHTPVRADHFADILQ